MSIEAHSDPARLPATELVALYRTKKLSPVEAMKATLARIERFNGRQRLLPPRSGRRAGRRPRLRSSGGWPARPKASPTACRWASRTISRSPGMPARFGSKLTGTDPQTIDAPAVARLQGAWRRRARQDRHARIRLEGHQRQPAHRLHAQPVGHAHDHRRLLGRRGCLRRARHGRAAARHRRRRLDPHPGRLHRLLRHEADARAGARLSGRRRSAPSRTTGR